MDFFHPREPVNTWSHGVWLVMALWGVAFLWRCGRQDRARRFVLLIYGVSMVFCSASSTLFHGIRTSDKSLRTFELMDNISIYLLIAGTYTPIVWTFLRGYWRSGVLGLVWFWAALGILIHISCGTLPAWQPTTYYLAMGWGAIFCYFKVVRGLSHRILAPILAGGVLYSVGAAFNLLNWPVLWPGVFQAHELFHLFVVAASLLHFYFMLTVVAPWVHDPVPPLPLATEGTSIGW
jgi:hemolysin III